MNCLLLQIPDAQGTPIQVNGVGGMPNGGPDALANIVGTRSYSTYLNSRYSLSSLFYLGWKIG